MQKGRRILVVDDEENFADNLKTFLQRSGNQVVVTHSGDQAIETAQSFAPELAILDFNMPGMTGIQTIDALRQRLGNIGCILMSGHLPDEALAQVSSCGIRHVLGKPFGFTELDSLLALPEEELALEAVAPSVASSFRGESGVTERRRSPMSSNPPYRLTNGRMIYSNRRQTRTTVG